MKFARPQAQPHSCLWGMYICAGDFFQKMNYHKPTKLPIYKAAESWYYDVGSFPNIPPAWAARCRTPRGSFLFVFLGCAAAHAGKRGRSFERPLRVSKK